MSDDPERDYYAEALAILAGTTTRPPETAHLKALEEMRRVDRIHFSKMLELLKQEVLRHP